MKKGMRKVLEEVVAEVLRNLPPDTPEFNKVKNFAPNYTIGKVKRKTR